MSSARVDDQTPYKKNAMMIFANPEYLFLLILALAIPVVYAVVRWLRVLRIRRFGDEQLVRELMPSWSGAKGWVRIILFSLAFAFFILGLSRPQIGAKLSQRETRGAEIMICLDVSNSMLAQDYSPDRLSRAKLAISRLVDKLEGDRIGLIIFAGSSFVQLPITTDYVSAKMFLSSVNTESVPIQGTAIGDAISTAIRGFSAQSEKSRAIIVITDGENHEDDAVQAAKQAAELGIKVYTIGVGSVQGEPIPKNGDLMKDSKGNIVVTRLDEGTLQDIAGVGGGAYIHAGNEEFGLNPIINDLKKMEDETFNSVVFEEYDEQFMYFFGIALVLFVLEMLIGERRLKKHLFDA
ncbi:MAG: VWA domain-containing protein [Bacteroidales bacterium]|nr:VWA domain-containing protein [Bacteroidales bacterium]